MDRELWALFRDESAEGLQRLDAELKRAALPDGARAVNSAMRILHNLKGGARVAGLGAMERTAHSMETALAEARTSGAPPSEAVLAQLREGMAQLSAVLAHPDGEPEPAPTPGPQSSPPPAVRAPDASTVRIEAARLDELMRFAGELITAHGRLSAHVATVDDLRTQFEPLDGLARALRSDVARLGQVVADWSIAIKRARMLPIAGAIPRWRLIAMEAANAVRRDLDFAADVGDIELDRQVLDAIGDPIMHLLRNAVDHGIETPKDRAAAKKPPVGRVFVQARAVGSIVELEISDDGRGIDTRAVLVQARKRGDSEESLARLTDAEAADLVFDPGLSTASRVTEVSGRGVGLDAARRRLAEIGGTVRVGTSRLGGATFYLQVPATVVSARGILVRTQVATYVIPTTHIARTVRFSASAVQVVDGESVVRLEGEGPMRIRWLGSLLGESRTTDDAKLPAVVIGEGAARIGLVVSAIAGELEFVARPLPWNAGGIRGVTGATITSDGAVALVLDVHRILADARGRTDARVHRVQVQAMPRRHRLLIADDSLTSRTLVRNILNAAGYDVTAVVDGEAAWNRLAVDTFDLVVSDVEMPNLTGLDLTRRIRATEATRHLPVVLVTSRDDPADLEAGAAAGADEYIVKGRFDQRQLLEAVVRLLAVLLCVVLAPRAFAEEPESDDDEQPIQEVFAAELVYPQEAREVQLTLTPEHTWCCERAYSIPIAIEYGFTDAWQLEVEWAALHGFHPAGEAGADGIGDLSVGTKYSFMNIGDSNVHAAIGLETTFPTGDAKRELGEGVIAFEPSFMFAVDAPTANDLQVFGQIAYEQTNPIGATDEADDEIGAVVGLFVPIRPVTLTGELAVARSTAAGEDLELTAVPGLVFDLPGTWELGLAAPLGLEPDQVAVTTTAMLIYEFDLPE